MRFSYPSTFIIPCSIFVIRLLVKNIKNNLALKGDISEYDLKPDYSRILTLNIKHVVQRLNSRHFLSNQGEEFALCLISVLFLKNLYRFP